MNPPRSLRRWLVGSVILLGALGLIALVVLRDRAKEQANGDEDEAGEPVTQGDPKDAAKMVDAIVNRNKPPKLMERPRGSWPNEVALYPESYDWNEEERVRTAIRKLLQDRTLELWEELVRRGDDRSYCVVEAIEKREDAEIRTVGAVCTRIAYSRLVDVFERHMPPIGPDGRRKWDPDIGNLAVWRKERANKPLYELQIEVGEKALLELSRSVGVAKEEIDSSRKGIEAVIKKLRRAKQPILLKGSFLLGGSLYSEEGAKRAREAVRRGSSEFIDID